MALVRQFLLQALVIAVPFLLQGCGTSDDSQPSKARKASEVVNVPGWPDVKGKFPLSFGIKAGSLVYASGMQGMDMKTMKLVEGGVQEETKQILKNLGELLQAAGSSMQQVTLCSVSLVNITRDFKDMNQAYSSFWPAAPPARVAVQVAALAGNASVEIQCTAALDGKNRTTVQVPGFPDLTAKGFPLSWATKVDGMLYLSGAQGMDMATGKVVSGGVQAETTQALQNLEKVLQAASSNAGRAPAATAQKLGGTAATAQLGGVCRAAPRAVARFALTPCTQPLGACVSFRRKCLCSACYRAASQSWMLSTLASREKAWNVSGGVK
ncbi:unnamed protein product [Effrenium voratum]|nr:unnamed protein product [Effrenium voratum]